MIDVLMIISCIFSRLSRSVPPDSEDAEDEMQRPSDDVEHDLKQSDDDEANQDGDDET